MLNNTKWDKKFDQNIRKNPWLAPLDYLLRAREFLSKESNWCQGHYLFRDPVQNDGEVQACAVGALWKAEGRLKENKQAFTHYRVDRATKLLIQAAISLNKEANPDCQVLMRRYKVGGKTIEEPSSMRRYKVGGKTIEEPSKNNIVILNDASRFIRLPMFGRCHGIDAAPRSFGRWKHANYLRVVEMYDRAIGLAAAKVEEYDAKHRTKDDAHSARHQELVG